MKTFLFDLLALGLCGCGQFETPKISNEALSSMLVVGMTEQQVLSLGRLPDGSGARNCGQEIGGPFFRCKLYKYYGPANPGRDSFALPSHEPQLTIIFQYADGNWLVHSWFNPVPEWAALGASADTIQ